MKRSVLTRLGGLAAIVGGIAWTAAFLLGDLLVRYLPLGPLKRSIQTGSIQAPALALLMMGAMAAIVAIAALRAQQSRRDALLGTLVASLTAFVGLAISLVCAMSLMGEFMPIAPGPIAPDWALPLLIVGLVVATGGIVPLGIIATIGRGLPWWGGAALIAGSPPLAYLWLFLGRPWLLGMPWAVVGYAVFRAAARRAEQPSRVR